MKSKHIRGTKAWHKEKAGTPDNVFRDSLYDARNNHIPVTCSLLSRKGFGHSYPKCWTHVIQCD